MSTARSEREVYDAFYRGNPPWEIGRAQPALAELARSGKLQGRVLDAGCGTGDLSLELASHGLSVLGIDVSPLAIAKAQAKAQSRGFAVDFLVWDARELSGLGHRFDTVIDSGLFHVLDAPETYVEGLRTLLRTSGRVHLLCYCDEEPAGLGPRRVSASELREAFSIGFRLDSLTKTQCNNHRNDGAVAWLASFTRVFSP